MIRFIRSISILFALCFFVALQADAFTIDHFGGEIPWPLSHQHVVTVSNSQGLWNLTDKNKEQRLFNLEMAREPSGLDWIRISELNPETYEVVSWGEGYFNAGDYADKGSSFSNIVIGGNQPANDSIGRYISMFPNGNLNALPYTIRVVEVETSLGNVLGLTVIDLENQDYEHMLGARVFAEPLKCSENVRRESDLKCYIQGSPF